MRNFTLSSLLVITSLAAVAYVYQKPAATRGANEPLEMKSVTQSVDTCEAAVQTVPCEKCKSHVVDVVDLNAAYSNSPLVGSPISFEEPPYAKAREVQPVKYEQPSVETAPAPRLVK